MIKLKRLCDCTSAPASGGIQERVWESQLEAKQIVLNGDIKDDLIEKAVLQIFNFNMADDMNESAIVGYVREPIKIFINSHGGNLDEAFSLIGAIESSKTEVHTVALGKAASAGFMITLAGDRRYCQRYTDFMYHQGSSGMIGEFKKIADYAEYCKEEQERLEEYVARRTKIKPKKLREIFESRKDWYMKAEEALELGVVDEII